MWINSLDVEKYGKFTSGMKLTNLNNDINLIYGKNEAGKTTLFNLFLALIYGFYPANREDYPYINWNDDKVEFQGEIIVGNRNYTIKRTLKSKPTLELFDGEKNEKLSNQPLKFASHVSKDIYRNVYSIESNTLNMFTGKTWDEVQEKLLFNMGSEQFKSPGKIIDELERQSGEIWRANRRGNQLVRQIENEIRELKVKKSKALKMYSTLSQLEVEKNRLEDEIMVLNQRLDSKNEMVSKLKDLLPVIEKIQQKKKLESKLIESKDINIPLKQDYP